MTYGRGRHTLWTGDVGTALDGRMEARSSMVSEATFFARVSEDAFELGLLGCRDRSKYVRDRTFWVVNRGDDPYLPDVGRDIDRE